ncbi:MAG TPA: sugar transferase [Bryobacteraceae bacterium]|jgi:lipopolysaccharide/colanic/teichoic acid biosynthesis glycosyltransferase|nr:sugar transferase [Bryobacteraceae bacterium]
MNPNRSYRPRLHTPVRKLLEEATFERTLAVERKRSERSGRLFLLMLLDLGGMEEGAGKRKVVARILAALTRSVRETDALGWHVQDNVLGLIFTEIPKELRATIASAMLARIKGILYRELSFEDFNRIEISHYLFPEEWNHDLPQRPSHPSLYTDLTRVEKDKSFYSVAKRGMDIAGAALGLLAGAPLLGAIALAVKCTSRGPVLFRQTRVGQYGAPFTFLKFRSMYANNDPAIHREYVKSLIRGSANNTSGPGTQEGVYKLTKDPRVTRIGAFLRKSSLDELPQLWNVLKGDMSLVGPRPAIPYEVEAYAPWHRRRVLEAKPGITGLWQVKGRSRVTFDEMVRLDVRYASSRSLWLDVKTLIETPRAVLFGQGAH